jgi:hypothetical protein
MKLLVLSVVIGLAVAYPSNEASSQELSETMPHFETEGLSSQFQRYQLPSESQCDAEVGACVACGHRIAEKCMELWMASDEGDQLRACESDDEGVVEADRAWQRASSKYHRHMQQCLKGEDPPTEEHVVFGGLFSLLKRKKRHASGSSGSSEECLEDYEDHNACWAALHTNHQECGAKIVACPAFARCTGRGDEPTDATHKRWYDIMKQCREDKSQKVREHLRLLHECLGHEEHQHMWGDHDNDNQFLF